FSETFGYIRVYFVHIYFTGTEKLGEQGAIYIYGPYLYVRVFFFQKHGGAGNRTAGSGRAHQVSDLSIRLIPYLRTGSFIMRQPVGQVIILVHMVGVRDLLSQPLGHTIVAHRV